MEESLSIHEESGIYILLYLLNKSIHIRSIKGEINLNISDNAIDRGLRDEEYELAIKRWA